MHHMAEHIRQSNMIEGIYSETEDARSLQAWLWLRAQPHLDHDVICGVQGRVTEGQKELADEHKGAYRNVNVRVGAHVAPQHQLVRYLMDGWLELYPTREPWDNHAHFEDIHPFADGNGRTGRMLMWYQEVTSDRPPTLFTAADRFTYYQRLDRWRASRDDDQG